MAENKAGVEDKLAKFRVTEDTQLVKYGGYRWRMMTILTNPVTGRQWMLIERGHGEHKYGQWIPAACATEIPNKKKREPKAPKVVKAAKRAKKGVTKQKREPRVKPKAKSVAKKSASKPKAADASPYKAAPTRKTASKTSTPKRGTVRKKKS